VPVGEWFTLKVRLVAGDDSKGRTIVDFIREKGDETRIFDVTGAIVYPDGAVPGFTTLSPMKLYTGGNRVCWPKVSDTRWMLIGMISRSRYRLPISTA